MFSSSCCKDGGKKMFSSQDRQTKGMRWTRLKSLLFGSKFSRTPLSLSWTGPLHSRMMFVRLSRDIYVCIRCFEPFSLTVMTCCPIFQNIVTRKKMREVKVKISRHENPKRGSSRSSCDPDLSTFSLLSSLVVDSIQWCMSWWMRQQSVALQEAEEKGIAGSSEVLSSVRREGVEWITVALFPSLTLQMTWYQEESQITQGKWEFRFTHSEKFSHIERTREWE